MCNASSTNHLCFHLECCWWVMTVVASHTVLSAFSERVCFVRQLGDWKLACLPHSWTEKSYVCWTEESENLAQQCLLAVRTTDETGRGLIGPVYYEREKEQKGRRNAEANIQRVSNGQALLYVISMWRWMMTEVDSSEIKNGKLMGQCGHELSTTPFMQCSLFSENNTD